MHHLPGKDWQPNSNRKKLFSKACYNITVLIIKTLILMAGTAL